MEKSRAIEILKPLVNSYVDHANITMKEEDDDTAEALEMAIEALKAQLSWEGTTSDLISRQAALDALRKCQTYLYDARDPELKIKLSSAKAAINNLPTIQPELDSETLIRTIENGITATNPSDAYSLGMRNGMRWCKSLIDGVEPKYEDGVTRVDDGIDSAELPPAQPEPHEGHWIKHETPDGGEQYECSRCGVLWEFNDGTPEDNEAYFCPKCGAKMKGE